ncbi:MAG: hypothetical protein EON90_09995 [Brevundimonas sp.]|nr:MAG: hypothetical protein EON90_09995 [Brevundimonas sp.]
MNRSEDRMAGSIDRQRDKSQASARTLQVRELAKSTVNCAVMNQPANDRAEFMGAAIRHLRDLYGAGEGEVEAVSLFGRLAWSATLQTSRVVATARAEHLFAANDGPPTVRDALISALNDPDHANESLRSVADDLERRR